MSQSAERDRRRRDRERRRQQVPDEPPSPDRSRAAIRDLLDIWPEEPLVTVTRSDDAYLRSTAIWTFAEHSVRTAKAILLLDDNRMYMQCGPLARLVSECGATAAWMAQKPMSGHALFKGAKSKHDRLIQGLAEMAGVPVPEDDPDAMTGLEDSKEEPPFRQRADFLDGGKWIHAYYRFLSGFSHGDGSLVQEYLEERDAEHQWGHRVVFRDPEHFRWRHVVLALTTVMLNFVLWSWNEVSEDKALREPLEQIGRKHGLGSRPLFDHDDPAKTAEPGA